MTHFQALNACYRKIACCENKFERLNFRSGSRIDLKPDLKSILRHFSACELKNSVQPVQVGVLERVIRTWPVHKSGPSKKFLSRGPYNLPQNIWHFEVRSKIPKISNIFPRLFFLTPRGVFYLFRTFKPFTVFLYSSIVSLNRFEPVFSVMNFLF